MTRDRFPTVVHVLLVRPRGTATEVFLLRRSGTGFMDGWHGLPGGHVLAGEGVAEAAARECREETGTAPEVLEPCCVLPYRSGRHQGVNFVFEGHGLATEPRIGEPDRCDLAGWYPVEHLPEPVAPWLRDVLDLRRRGDWFHELHWPG